MNSFLCGMEFIICDASQCCELSTPDQECLQGVIVLAGCCLEVLVAVLSGRALDGFQLPAFLEVVGPCATSLGICGLSTKNALPPDSSAITQILHS